MILTNIDTEINKLPKTSTNVTTALERIKGLRNLLSKIGGQDGLGLNLISTSTLETVVREFNTIVLQNKPSALTGSAASGAIVVDSGSKVVVPAGYYKNGFEVTGSVSNSVATELANLKNQLLDANIAGADEVLTGALTIRIVEKTDGTLEIQLLAGTVGSATNKLTAGGYLAEEGKSPNLIIKSGDKDLQTNIPYFPGGEVKIPITVKNVGGDETYAEISPINQGYYAAPVKVIPEINSETGNHVVNVEVNKTIGINIVSVNPSDDSLYVPFSAAEGFDYIKNGNIKVKEGTSTVKATVSGNQVILTPDTEEGWVKTTTVTKNSNGEELPKTESGSYIITIETTTSSEGEAIASANNIDADLAQELVVTPSAGYYDGNTAVPVKFDGHDVEFLTGVTTDSNSDYIVAPGFIPAPIKLGNSEITVKSTTDAENVTTIPVASPVFYVETNTGYTEGEIKKVNVRPASDISLTSEKAADGVHDKIVVSVGTSGWAQGETDVTGDFLSLAEQFANGLVDSSSGGTTTEAEISSQGQALFTYADNLDEAVNGILVKIPSGTNKYFTSAKVDLSALITVIDNI